MQSFIVLGIIPGTDIQTNLNFWIAFTALLTVFAFRNRFRAGRNGIRKYVAIRKIAYTIRNYELVSSL